MHGASYHSYSVQTVPLSVQPMSQTPAPAGMMWTPARPPPLTPPPHGLQLSRSPRPWRMYGRVLGLVVLCWLFIESMASGLIFMFSGDGIFSTLCLGFALCFLLGIVAMRRPRTVLVERAVADEGGMHLHPLTSGGSLATRMKTKFSRHLIHDDSILETPQTMVSWAIFVVAVVIALVTGIVAAFGGVGIFILALVIILPTILIGFSIPVMGWWSHSTWRLGLPTRRRHAEAWLIAGILSALPAMLINSWLFPAILPSGLSESVQMFLLLTVSAPVGEETMKGLAVLFFFSQMRSPRHGFQIGFTVGLGFAIIENLSYVMGAGFSPAGGDPISFAFTILIRGIGSIPGHAFWTSLTGVGFGWMAYRNRKLALMSAAALGRKVDAPKEDSVDWILVDPITGQKIATTQDELEGEQIAASMAQIWNPQITPLAQSVVARKESFGLPLPTNAVAGWLLAIVGHATWNGSSYLVEFLAQLFGWPDVLTVLVMLGWIALLVAGVLLIGSGLLRGVRNAPDGSDLDELQSSLSKQPRNPPHSQMSSR